MFVVQDGTINYLNLPAVTDGLRFLSAYLPFLPLRLNILSRYLIDSLNTIQHETSDTPVVRVLSRVPSARLRSVGEQSDTGSVISLVFLAVSTHLRFGGFSFRFDHVSLMNLCFHSQTEICYHSPS